MDELFNAITEYNQSRNALGLLNRLAVLVQQFTDPPETPSEHAFVTAYLDGL